MTAQISFYYYVDNESKLPFLIYHHRSSVMMYGTVAWKLPGKETFSARYLTEWRLDKAYR